MILSPWRRPRDPVLRRALGCSIILLAIISFHELLRTVLHRASRGNYEIDRDTIAGFIRIEQGLILFVIGFYGFIRSQGFHPATNPQYRRWLALTPWTPIDPLPLGSVLLTIADAGAVAMALLATKIIGDARPLIPAVVFIAAYLFGASTWLRSTKRREWWAVAYGLGLLLVPTIPTACLLVILVGLYFLVRHAFFRSLYTFPWGLDDPKPAKPISKWPLSQIGPVVMEARSDFARISAVWNASALIGWFVFCVLTFQNADFFTNHFKRSEIVYACITIGEMIALVRWCAYQANCHAPISFWGRIRSGRWIIPGYDRALAAPLLLALLAGVLPYVLDALRLPIPLLAGIFMCVMCGLAFSLGPAMWRWRLTGQYQMPPPVQGLRSTTAR